MKKLLALVLAVTAFALAGCGGSADKPADNAKAEKVVKVGASPVPHAEILEAIRPELEKEGVKLEIVLGVHVEPMGIYSHKIKKLDELKDGASVSIPSDPTNGGRALLLLARANLIKLKDGAGTTATVQDIVDNPKHLKIQEIEAPQLPRTLDDVDISVINTNWAMQADLVPTRDALIMEDKTSPYVNILVVRQGDENRPEIQALVKALHSETVKNFINDKYKGAIVPAF